MNIIAFATVVCAELLLIAWAFVRAKHLDCSWLWRLALILVILSAVTGVNDVAIGPNPLTSSGLQAFGNPTVFVVFQREHGEWTDYVAPPSLCFLIAAANHLFLAGIALGPFLLTQALALWRKKQNHTLLQ